VELVTTTTHPEKEHAMETMETMDKVTEMAALEALRAPVRQFVHETGAIANFWAWAGCDFTTWPASFEPLRDHVGGDATRAATLVEDMIKGEQLAREYGPPLAERVA
jgi:hypothetical protein